MKSYKTALQDGQRGCPTAILSLQQEKSADFYAKGGKARKIIEDTQGLFCRRAKRKPVRNKSRIHKIKNTGFVQKQNMHPVRNLYAGLTKAKQPPRGALQCKKARYGLICRLAFFIAGGVFFTADFVKDLTKICTRLVNCIIAKNGENFVNIA